MKKYTPLSGLFCLFVFLFTPIAFAQIDNETPAFSVNAGSSIDVELPPAVRQMLTEANLYQSLSLEVEGVDLLHTFDAIDIFKDARAYGPIRILMHNDVEHLIYYVYNSGFFLGTSRIRQLAIMNEPDENGMLPLYGLTRWNDLTTKEYLLPVPEYFLHGIPEIADIDPPISFSLTATGVRITAADFGGQDREMSMSFSTPLGSFSMSLSAAASSTANAPTNTESSSEGTGETCGTTPSATPSATPTGSSTPSPTPSATPSPSPSPECSESPSPTPQATGTPCKSCRGKILKAAEDAVKNRLCYNKKCTLNGKVACAATTNMVLDNAGTGMITGRPGSPGLATADMAKKLEKDPNWCEVSKSDAKPGDVVISPTYWRKNRSGKTERKTGHVGILGKCGKILSNKSAGVDDPNTSAYDPKCCYSDHHTQTSWERRWGAKPGQGQKGNGTRYFKWCGPCICD